MNYLRASNESDVLRLVIVSSRFPYPLIKGDKLRLYHQIRLLRQHWSICLISITDKDVPAEDQAELAKLCEEIHIFNLPKWKSAAGISKNFLGKIPLQVSYFYDRTIHGSIKEIMASFSPDVAFFQLVRTALYAQDCEVPAVLDFMDSFSTIAERDAQFSSGIRKVIFKKEAKKLKKFEAEIAEHFEGMTVISKNDKMLMGLDSLQVISNGVDIDYFKPDNDFKEFDICFVGNLGYAPNQRAVEMLVKKILPRIRFKKPNVSLLIAGARPTHKIKSMSDSHISVMGDLEDIRMAYSLCKVFVAPIFTGAGQQNKILEAIAMGLPCVTSSIVNSSIEANPSEIKIGFSVDDFVRHTIDLLYDKNLYLQQSDSGLAMVKSRYSWNSQVAKLDQYLKEISQIKT